MEKLFTPKELAERYGYEVATLATWRYKRKGPRATKRGGKVFYKESDVLAWEAEEDARVASA
jgi:predicted site-specific integrase-resolvase